MTQPVTTESVSQQFIDYISPFLKKSLGRGDEKICINMLPAVPGIAKKVLQACERLGFRGVSCIGRASKPRHATYSRYTGYCESDTGLKSKKGSVGLRLFPNLEEKERISRIVDRQMPRVCNAVQEMIDYDEPLVVNTVTLDVKNPPSMDPAQDPRFKPYYRKGVQAPVEAIAFDTNRGAKGFKEQLLERLKQTDLGQTAYRISVFAPRLDIAHYSDGAAYQDLNLLKEHEWHNVEKIESLEGMCSFLPRYERLPVATLPQGRLPELTEAHIKEADAYVERLVRQLKLWKKHNVGGVEIDVPEPQTEELAIRMRDQLVDAGYTEVELMHRYYVMDDGWKLKGEFYAGDWDEDKLCVPDYGLRIFQNVKAKEILLPPATLVDENDYMQEYHICLEEILAPLRFEGAIPSMKLVHRQIRRQILKELHTEKCLAVRFVGNEAYVYRFSFGVTDVDRAAIKKDGGVIYGPKGVHQDYKDIQDLRVRTVVGHLMQVVEEKLQSGVKDLRIPYEYCRDEYVDRRDGALWVDYELQKSGFAAQLVDALDSALYKTYGKEIRWKLDSEFLKIKPGR